MKTVIRLTMIDGAYPGKEYEFGCRTVCTVGRANDCLLRLPSDGSNLTISRRHCLLDIDPPEVRVRDLGSRNGTFVNDRLIGRRELGQSHSNATMDEPPEVELHEGDEIRLGNTVLRVEIVPIEAGTSVMEQALVV